MLRENASLRGMTSRYHHLLRLAIQSTCLRHNGYRGSPQHLPCTCLHHKRCRNPHLGQYSQHCMRNAWTTSFFLVRWTPLGTENMCYSLWLRDQKNIFQSRSRCTPPMTCDRSAVSMCPPGIWCTTLHQPPNICPDHRYRMKCLPPRLSISLPHSSGKFVQTWLLDQWKPCLLHTACSHFRHHYQWSRGICPRHSPGTAQALWVR